MLTSRGLEKDIAKVKIGQAVGITVPAYPDEVFQGKVSYVGDIVAANIQAAEATGVAGAYNVGSQESVTINMLAEMVAERVPEPTAVRYSPARSFDVLHSVADCRSAAAERQKSSGTGDQLAVTHGFGNLLRGSISMGIALPSSCR